MVSSEGEICSLALGEVGDSPIVDLTDDSDRARLCLRLYAPTRDRCLRTHPWTFATVRLALAASASTPIDLWEGYTYQFPLPSDCLRVLDTSLSDPRQPYKVELLPGTGKVILTDSSALSIKYIKRVKDVGLYDDIFVFALKHLLASQLAIPLIHDSALAKTQFALFKDCLQEARTTNGMEGTLEVFQVNDLIDVRNGLSEIPDKRSGWI